MRSLQDTLLLLLSGCTLIFAMASEQRPSQYYPSFFGSLPSMAGKTVVITGCSRGLGFVTARAVSQKGGSVIMLNRPGRNAGDSFQRLKDESTNNIVSSPGAAATTTQQHHLVDCDLLSFESVKEACRKVRDIASGKNGIHVLCNNAGIMLQPDEASQDGYDITLQTNMLSHFLITRELMPCLKQGSLQSGRYSRVVTMSSASGYGRPPLDNRFFEPRGGSLGGARASYERYHQSKLANLAFTAALHDRLIMSDNTSIQAIACTPGVCGTDMFVHATTVMNGQPSPKSMVPSTEDGAMSQLKCIFDPEVRSGELWGPGRNGALECTPMKPPQILVDSTSKALIWEACEKAVGKFEI